MKVLPLEEGKYLLTQVILPFSMMEVYNRYGYDRPDPKDQGFYTSSRDFLSREEAWKIAEAFGQIIPETRKIAGAEGVLYSENLW